MENSILISAKNEQRLAAWKNFLTPEQKEYLNKYLKESENKFWTDVSESLFNSENNVQKLKSLNQVFSKINKSFQNEIEQKEHDSAEEILTILG